KGQARSFLIVANVDVSFKGRFVTKDFVVISLVRTDRDIQGSIQIHPGHIAFKVIVGTKGIGAGGEELLQAGITRKIGGLAQQLSSLAQVGLIFLIERDHLEFVVIVTPDDRKKTEGL